MTVAMRGGGGEEVQAGLAARKFKRAFEAVVPASGEGTLRVVRLGSMTRS
jgi:hypothetical protein